MIIVIKIKICYQDIECRDLSVVLTCWLRRTSVRKDPQGQFEGSSTPDTLKMIGVKIKYFQCVIGAYACLSIFQQIDG